MTRNRNCNDAGSSRIRGRRTVLAAGLALAAAACGNAEGQQQTADTGDGTPQGVYEAFVEENMPGVGLELVEGAADEGHVVFYTSTNTASNAVAEEFGRIFPFVTVEQVQIAGGSLVERFAAEAGSGTHVADVINTSSEPDVRDFAANGWCEKYTPASDASYPDTAKLPSEVYRWGGSVQGIAFIEGSLDDDEIETLSTWEGLADESNQDKLFGWIDVSAGGSTVFNNAYMYEEFGTQLWEDHLANVEGTRVYGGTNPTTAALLQGEIDITGPVGLSGPYDQWDGGAPLAWITPTPVLASPAAGCIATEPPNPNAAKLLWEFILSDPGQQAMAPYGQVSYKSDLGEVELPERLTEQDWYRPVDNSQIYELPAERVDELRDTVIAEWRAVFGV